MRTVYLKEKEKTKERERNQERPPQILLGARFVSRLFSAAVVAMVTPGPFVFNRWTVEETGVLLPPPFVRTPRVLLKSALRVRQVDPIG